MVNGISFGGSYPHYSKQDVENIAKYVAGTEVVNQADGPMDGMGLMLGISALSSGYQGVKWLKNAYRNPYETEGLDDKQLKAARKAASPFKQKGGWTNWDNYDKAGSNISSAWTEAVGKAKAEGQLFKDNGGLKSWDAYKAAIDKQRAQTILDCIPKPEKLAKLDEATRKVYEAAEKAANEVKSGAAKDVSASLEEANKALVNGRAMAHGQIKAEGFFGKIAQGFSKYSGMSKVSGWAKNLAKESPTMSKILKYGKGNGAFLAITGGIELLTQVIPAFAQNGFGSGIKQLFKSGTKTAANVGGWAAGSAVGASAGAAIGAAIGSFIPIPGIGTIIGGAVGMACGCVGSWLASKAVDKVVGKNELDKTKENQAKELAQQVGQNPDGLQALVQAGLQKAQAEGGAQDPNAQAALKSLMTVASSMPQQNNPFANYAQA